MVFHFCSYDQWSQRYGSTNARNIAIDCIINIVSFRFLGTRFEALKSKNTSKVAGRRWNFAQDSISTFSIIFVYFLENGVKNGEFNITPYGTSRICIPRLDRASIWFETPPDMICTYIRSQ